MRLFTWLFRNILTIPKLVQFDNFPELYIYREEIFYFWLCLSMEMVEKEKTVSLLLLHHRRPVKENYISKISVSVSEILYCDY